MMKPIFERRNRSGMPPVYAMGHYGRRGVAAQADSSRRRRACRYGYEKRSHECESGTRESARYEDTTWPRFSALAGRPGGAMEIAMTIAKRSRWFPILRARR